MPRRFNDLEARAIALLKDGKDPSESNDDELKAYWSWKLWKDKSKHKRDEASKRSTKGTSRVIIFPFAISGTEAHHYATVSDRAYDASFQGKDKLNWKTGVANTVKIIAARNFKPARANIRAIGANVSTSTSKITGREYKTKFTSANQGYSVPFGRDGTNTELKTQQDIIVAVTSGRVSFRSEMYKSPTKVKGLA